MIVLLVLLWFELSVRWSLSDVNITQCEFVCEVRVLARTLTSPLGPWCKVECKWDVSFSRLSWLSSRWKAQWLAWQAGGPPQSLQG